VRDGEVIAELFRQVYAHPDDDHVRQVLSDALVLIGDPRGELIQLQLHPSADLERRAMQLIQRHGLTWLGGLRGAVVPLAYERGFLARCMVVTEDVVSVAGCDEWSTVHTIELSSGSRGFVLHPVMRALRRLVGVSPNVLLDLANKYQPKLEQLAVDARYSPRFDDLLGRYLPASSIGTLTLVDVPHDRAARLRSLAARHTRMKLQLHVLPPAIVERDDDDRFDDVDE
jgi:uncharacterized protein (TIGR02996 family)